MKFSTLCLLLLALLLVSSIYAQKGVEPDRLPFPNTNDQFDTVLRTRSQRTDARLDPAQLQRQATELLALSQSLQPDIQNLNRGVLPKQTIEKLKRIEKLSKQLRGEISMPPVK